MSMLYIKYPNWTVSTAENNGQIRTTSHQVAVVMLPIHVMWHAKPATSEDFQTGPRLNGLYAVVAAVKRFY